MQKLVEFSRRYGSNPELVLAGGGNTSMILPIVLLYHAVPSETRSMTAEQNKAPPRKAAGLYSVIRHFQARSRRWCRRLRGAERHSSAYTPLDFCPGNDRLHIGWNQSGPAERPGSVHAYQPH